MHFSYHIFLSISTVLLYYSSMLIRLGPRLKRQDVAYSDESIPLAQGYVMSSDAILCYLNPCMTLLL